MYEKLLEWLMYRIATLERENKALNKELEDLKGRMDRAYAAAIQIQPEIQKIESFFKTVKL